MTAVAPGAHGVTFDAGTSRAASAPSPGRVCREKASAPLDEGLHADGGGVVEQCLRPAPRCLRIDVRADLSEGLEDPGGRAVEGEALAGGAPGLAESQCQLVDRNFVVTPSRAHKRVRAERE